MSVARRARFGDQRNQEAVDVNLSAAARYRVVGI